MIQLALRLVEDPCVFAPPGLFMLQYFGAANKLNIDLKQKLQSQMLRNCFVYLTFRSSVIASSGKQAAFCDFQLIFSFRKQFIFLMTQ